jgi:hypothetical protein
VPGAKAPDGAGAGGPMWPLGISVVAGIEAQTRDFDEGVAFARVDGDVFAFAGLPKFAEGIGGGGPHDEAGTSEDIGDGTRAVVAGIVEAAMAAAVFVGSAGDLIAGMDGCEDPGRQVGRGDGDVAVEDCCFAPSIVVLPGARAEHATA